MKNLKIIGIICCFFIAGCSPLYYIPNTQNVPLITKQGETNLTVLNNSDLFELQGACGLTDNIAIQLNGGLCISPEEYNENGGSGNIVELGVGYYKPLKNKLVFETYGLIGMGNVENHLPSTKEFYPLTNGDISAKILRYGIQPNFGYKTKHFSAALSSRFLVLNYNDIKGDLIFKGVDQIDYLNANKTNFIIEPAITLKGGLERLKFQVQYGLSLNLSNKNFQQREDYITFGLNYRFNFKQKLIK
jgi:hypothetical protein